MLQKFVYKKFFTDTICLHTSVKRLFFQKTKLNLKQIGNSAYFLHYCSNSQMEYQWDQMPLSNIRMQIISCYIEYQVFNDFYNNGDDISLDRSTSLTK